jgi:hypothetical protein
MKTAFLFLVFFTFLAISSCKSKNYKTSKNELMSKQMDFISFEERFYKGIKFQLPSNFRTKERPKFTLKSNSFAEYMPELNLYFSIERFTQKEGIKIQNEFTENTSMLDAINDQYIYKRQASLYNSYTSVKKEISSNLKYNGCMQVIQGETYDGYDKNCYFTATIQVLDEYYIIQLIGPKNNMGYLYDDFNEIISSVKKIK